MDQRQLDLYPDLLGRQDVDGIVDQLLAGGFDVEGDPVGVGQRRDWCPPRGNLDRNGLLLGLAARADQRNLLLATAVAVARMRGSPNRLKILGLRRSMLRRRGVRPTAQADAWFFRHGSLRVEAPHGGCCARGKDCQRKDRSCDCFHG